MRSFCQRVKAAEGTANPSVAKKRLAGIIRNSKPFVHANSADPARDEQTLTLTLTRPSARARTPLAPT
jgi:hypothetical protein